VFANNTNADATKRRDAWCDRDPSLGTLNVMPASMGHFVEHCCNRRSMAVG
jgi:hypothetical protein